MSLSQKDRHCRHSPVLAVLSSCCLAGIALKSRRRSAEAGANQQSPETARGERFQAWRSAAASCGHDAGAQEHVKLRPQPAGGTDAVVGAETQAARAVPG